VATKKVSFFALLVAVLFAIPLRADSDSQITLRIYNAASVPGRTLLEAEQQLGYIFHTAGIAINILNCPVNPLADPTVTACPQSLGPSDLVVRLIPRGKASDETFGLAFLPAEGKGKYSDVFYEPVLQMRKSLSSKASLNEGRLLGHVIAHEVGHLLLGSHSHSSLGIMVARWQDSELRLLSTGNLLFTPEQAEKMRDGTATLRSGLTPP
jgi:hypothetical protein